MHFDRVDALYWEFFLAKTVQKLYTVG